MFQHLLPFLYWLASPQGFTFAGGLLALATALGAHPRGMAALLAALSFWAVLA